jgi:hypothetical protein
MTPEHCKPNLKITTRPRLGKVFSRRVISGTGKVEGVRNAYLTKLSCRPYFFFEIVQSHTVVLEVSAICATTAAPKIWRRGGTAGRNAAYQSLEVLDLGGHGWPCQTLARLMFSVSVIPVTPVARRARSIIATQKQRTGL